MLYMVTRTDGTGWDQYSAVLIKARSVKEAYKLATSLAYGFTEDDLKHSSFGMRFAGFRRDGSNLRIEQINPASHGDPEVVLASFNRG